ncbi:MAG: helix-turn-helix transcriptional regulator [Bryobacterales bacterium]|nr:helix-turn-helix transcriptional regulator [Bryobacterales bacterium]MBV9399833.1 helix-turn-helix transcriptional regulator [Bryobacterales bacterium]
MRHVSIRRIDEGPLSEPVLLILTALADRPRHGYALITEIETISRGRVRLSTGTLYGALHRLLNAGWIERFDQQDTSRDKQAYRLTALGRGHLQTELDRMQQLTRTATARLKTAGAEV